MSMPSTEVLEKLFAAESLFASPIPVQSVSSDGFGPGAQLRKQREFEARVEDLGSRMTRRLGMGRRGFFQTALDAYFSQPASAYAGLVRTLDALDIARKRDRER